MHLKAKLTKGLARVAVIAAWPAVLAVVFVFARALQTGKHLHNAAEHVQELQPRVTLTGRLRGALAPLWFLGPLRPDPVLDPLTECGVGLFLQPWWEAVLKVRENQQRLDCLRQRTRLAQEDHLQFKRRLFRRLVLCLNVLTMATLFAIAVHVVFDASRPGTDTPYYGESFICATPVVPPKEEGKNGKRTTAPSTSSPRRKRSFVGADKQEAFSWPSMRVLLTPQASLIVYLHDSVVPACFTAEDHKDLHVFLAREARKLKEPLFSGSMAPLDMQRRLRDTVEDFLSERVP